MNEQEKLEAVLSAARYLLFVNENKLPGVSREDAERPAWAGLREAVDRFEHPAGCEAKAGS